MNSPRLITAIVISLLGTLVLYFIGALSIGLVGSHFDLAFCFIGAFFSTLLFFNHNILRYKSNIYPSVKIVFATFLMISVGHAFEQVFSRQVAIDFEPVGMFFWATVMTSWWLIPTTAFSLYMASHFFRKKRKMGPGLDK